MTALFSIVQAGAAAAGTGSVALTCAATGAGNTLTAVVLAPSTAAFTPPDSNWRGPKTVAAGTAGHLEIWYLEGKYNPGGVTSVTFAGPAGVTCHGVLTEVSIPDGYIIVLESVGQASGTGGATMALASAAGNAADCLAFMVFADFFSAAQTGTWTHPAGTTTLRAVVGGTVNFYAAAVTDLAAGMQSFTSGYTATTGETGWCAALITLRAIQFEIVGIDGGEMLHVVAADPTGQMLLAGGDVEGLWKSADYGDHWQTTLNGATSNVYNSVGAVAFSVMPGEPAGTAYAFVGSNGSNGGLLASTDGMVTWSLRSSGIQCKGHTPSTPGGPNPQPAAEPGVADRWVGNLLAQDPVNGWMYACDVNSGIKRSSSNGSTWTAVNGGLPANAYTRAIVLNPANLKEGWTGGWSTSGDNNGGVWHCADLTVAAGSVTWTRLTGYTGTVADLTVIGTWLYAACHAGGLFRAPVAGGALTSLNGSYIDTTTSLWQTVDGYTSGPADVLIAGAGIAPRPSGSAHNRNIVKLTIPGTWPGSGTITYADLTNSPGGSIIRDTVPPDGRPWYLAGANYQAWLGGNVCDSIHLAVDPSTVKRIYVAHGGGFTRTSDGGVNWEMAVNGMAMWDVKGFAVDPNQAAHYTIHTDDHGIVDVGPDPFGMTGVQSSVPTAGLESHCGSFDPGDTPSTLYIGVNKKFNSNALGDVLWRHGNQPNGPWTSLGFGVPAGGACCMGVYAGRDASGTRFVIAVGQGAGLYRAVHSGAWPGGTWTWTRESAAIGTSGQVGQYVPIISGNGKTIYVFDRKAGVFRNDNYGDTAGGNPWQLIWPKVITGTAQDGYIALNPNVNGELWVSTTDTHGLWKLSSAFAGVVGQAGGPTATNITSAVPNPKGIAFYNGQLYAANLTAGGTPQLLTTADGGTTWTAAAGPEIAQYGQILKDLIITPSGVAVVGSSFNDAVAGSLTGASPAQLLTVATRSLPAGTVGTAYPAGTKLAAVNGITPYTWSWAAQPGSSLPPGLLLTTSGPNAGIIAGTPGSAAGSPFAITVTVTDSASPPNTASANLTISVTTSATLTVTTGSLPPGVAGTAYPSATKLAAVNGTTPYTWSWAAATGSSLPAGLSLTASGTNAGLISGTPTTPGAYQAVVTVTDSASHTATATLSITVLPALTVLTNNATDPLPGGQDGSTYPGALAASGGSGNGYAWTMNSGSLPAGLTLNSDGTFAGTLTGATSTFTVKITDSLGNTAVSGSLTITVAAATITITNTTLPDGTPGGAYGPVTLQQVNGTGPFTWTVVGTPALPSGISLNSSTGVLSGTVPNTPGTTVITFQVTDSLSHSDTATLALTINVLPLTITTLTLPPFTEGTFETVTLGVAGGVAGGYTWGAIDDQGNPEILPPGFAFTSGGVLSGTGTVTGSTPTDFQVTDSGGNTAEIVLNIVVIPAPSEGGSSEIMVLASDGVTWVTPSPESLAGTSWQPDSIYTLSGGAWA